MVLFTACQNQKIRYTQTSSEIDKTKALIKAYDIKNYEALTLNYADTAKLFINSVENSITPNQLVTLHQSDDDNFSEREFLTENQEYEMVVTDDGKTWVNFWGNWQGTLKGDNTELKIPVHVTFQFVNGKIVKEYGYWDNTPIVLALQKLKAKNLEQSTKSIK